MEFKIAGKGMNIGSSLQDYVKDRVEKTVHKYFERAISADIVFSKQNHFFKVIVMVDEGTGIGLLIKAESVSDDAYTAFDSSLIKIEKQLRKYKSKIKNHRKAKLSQVSVDNAVLVPATKYVLQPPSLIEEAEEDNDNSPVVIAEKPTSIEKLTVSEAVMKMDLAGLPALLFINAANGRINVVYHRVDGNISWVDPEK